MTIKPLHIRVAEAGDREPVLALHRDAFGQEEGTLIAELVTAMLEDSSAQPMFSFVAESEGIVVGHVLFTSVQIASESTSPAQILAPLAVAPQRQGQGVGTQLTEQALRQLGDDQVELVFVLGYPAYYRRFGFVPASPQGLSAPHPISDEHSDAWMLKELKAGALKQHAGTVRCCNILNQPQYWQV